MIEAEIRCTERGYFACRQKNLKWICAKEPKLPASHCQGCMRHHIRLCNGWMQNTAAAWQSRNFNWLLSYSNTVLSKCLQKNLCYQVLQHRINFLTAWISLHFVWRHQFPKNPSVKCNMKLVLDFILNCIFVYQWFSNFEPLRIPWPACRYFRHPLSTLYF